MSFLQPLLLVGLPLALIPIIIHLLNRLRYRSVKWGAIMFVLKANRSSTNMARIRQWLILAARAFAIFALILALSRPLIGGWLGWKLSGEPDTVIILLDRSATMGSNFSQNKNRLEKAIELITKAGKQSASTSQIVLIDNATLKIHEIPSWDVISHIEDSKITQTEADIPAMYRIALDYMLTNVTGVTEIWTLSDMQHSNWEPENSVWSELDSRFSSLSQPVSFRTLAVESEVPDNRSISFIKLNQYPGKEGKMVREIIFEINSPPGEEGTEIYPRINEKGSQRQFPVKLTGQSTKIRHLLNNGEEEDTIYGSIILPPDSNPKDNSLYFGFSPSNPEKAIVIYDNQKAATILGFAAAPEGEKKGQSSETFTSSEFKGINLESASIIICQVNPDKDMLENLRSFAQKGGNVIFFPPSVSTNSKESIWSITQTFEKDNKVIVADWDINDGPLANTVSGERLKVDGIKLKKRTLLKDSDAIPIATCSDGKPFLYGEKIGKGMMYYCTTIPVQDWSNLGDGLVIVPMLRRLMETGSARFSNLIFDECGKWKPLAGAEKYEILSSDKEKMENSNPVCDSGIYSQDGKTFILNRPVSENFYKKIDEAALKGLFEDNNIRMFREKSGSISKMQSGIWRLFIFAVLCAMSIEAFLCMPLKEKVKMKKKKV